MKVLWRISLLVAYPIILSLVVLQAVGRGVSEAAYQIRSQTAQETATLVRYWRETDRMVLDVKRAFKAGRTYNKLKRTALNIGGKQ